MSGTLTKAQAIALEKQKLIEKEKEIAAKLLLMKQAQNAAASKLLKDTAASAKVRTTTVAAKQAKSNSFTTASTKSQAQKQQKEQFRQDVIPITEALAPNSTTVAPHRRKSLLDASSSTIPNIPLTPRRSVSRDSQEEVSSGRKDISKSRSEESNCKVKAVHHDERASGTDSIVEERSNFVVPTGSQHENLCKVQIEKTEKQLKCRHKMFSETLTSFDFARSDSQAVLNVKKTTKPGIRDLDQDASHVGLSYTSPLLTFRAYRFNLNFRMKEKLSLQSKTYSNKLNPNCVLCPFDLQGTCNDDSCLNQHPQDYELNEQELLEDVVSYCPGLANLKDDATPAEISTGIGSYVEKLLHRHKGKMSVDKLGLWLASQVKEKCGKRNNELICTETRRWKPEGKVLDEKLSSHLKEFLTSQDTVTIRQEKPVQFFERDTVLCEEDVRYFISDTTSASLETEITRDMTNTQLWLRLARKKLFVPNRTPAECLDLALSVLSRGLEANQRAPDLWRSYLSLYRCHPEVQDFSHFCQSALEYAPSYDIWFLYLDSIKTFPEKDEISMNVLEFLWTTSNNQTVQGNTKTSINVSKVSEDLPASSTDKRNNTSPPNAVAGEDGALAIDATKSNKEPSSMNEFPGRDKLISHQVLEMIIYRLSLNVNAGRLKTAVNFVETILGVKAKASASHSDCLKSLSALLTVEDHLVLWLTLIHVSEWHQLPACFYGDSNQNPGRIMAKSKITMVWKAKPSLSLSLDRLVKLHTLGAQVWTARHGDIGHDQEAEGHYISLVQSLVSLLLFHDRFEKAVTVCREYMTGESMIELWLTLAQTQKYLLETKKVKQVFEEALSSNSSSAKLHFYHNMYLFTNGEEEQALSNLEQFAISHFDVTSGNLRECDPNVLYCRLLKQPEGLSLKIAHLKQKSSLPQHKDIHMWLCFCLLLELEGEMSEAVEMYERALMHALCPSDLVTLWQSYLNYLARSGMPVKELRDMVTRSISSIPTKFHTSHSIASDDSSLCPGLNPLLDVESRLLHGQGGVWWIDYHYCSQLVEAWLDVLPGKDQLDILEMCLVLQPSNVQLLLRTLDLCLEAKETRRAFSWCRLTCAQVDRPANIAFWKTAVAVAQTEGTQREIEQMFAGYVETMPLTIAGWKDFLLFEVSKKNQTAVDKLLLHCRRLGLSVDGFLATISPATTSSK